MQMGRSGMTCMRKSLLSSFHNGIRRATFRPAIYEYLKPFILYCLNIQGPEILLCMQRIEGVDPPAI